MLKKKNDPRVENKNENFNFQFQFL